MSAASYSSSLEGHLPIMFFLRKTCNWQFPQSYWQSQILCLSMHVNLKRYKAILCGAIDEVHGFGPAKPAKHHVSNLWRTK